MNCTASLLKTTGTAALWLLCAAWVQAQTPSSPPAQATPTGVAAAAPVASEVMPMASTVPSVANAAPAPPPPPPEGCRPLSDRAIAADLKAVTAHAQKVDLGEQAQLYREVVALWSKAVDQCEGRGKERAERNLAESLRASNSLLEKLDAGPECVAAHKDAASLQDLARAPLGESRWNDAATLYHKSEDMWDLAEERCTGNQQTIATQKREQAEIDGHNAEFCAPVFAKAREQGNRLRSMAASVSREDKQEGLQGVETLWREAASMCKGIAAREAAANNANAIAKERGTPWLARALPTPAATRLAAPATKPMPAAALANVSAAAIGPALANPSPPPVKAAPTPPAAALAATRPAAPSLPPAVAAVSAAAPAVAASTSALYVPASSAAGGLLGTLASALTPNAAPAVAAPAAAQPTQAEVQPSDFMADSTRFVGQFVRDANSPTYSGTGKMIWANGDVFEGTLDKSQRHGRGVFTWANGQRYDGDWVRDRQTGQARVQFVNGNRYEGPVVEGVPQGKGRMLYASGDVFEGQFRDGSPHGKGQYMWKNGQRYEGDWIDGQASGKGKLAFASGDQYEGSILNGDPHGQGTFTWTNGDKYAGAWVAGKKQGVGTFTWATGDEWEGVYENDQQSENGRLIRK